MMFGLPTQYEWIAELVVGMLWVGVAAGCGAWAFLNLERWR